jgi:hypothetical protein
MILMRENIMAEQQLAEEELQAIAGGCRACGLDYQSIAGAASRNADREATLLRPNLDGAAQQYLQTMIGHDKARVEAGLKRINERHSNPPPFAQPTPPRHQ